MNWEIGIDIYTLICIKWITNKNLLYKKINKIEFKKKVFRCNMCCADIFRGDREGLMYRAVHKPQSYSLMSFHKANTLE